MLSNMFIELSKQYEGEDNNADYIKYFNEGEVDIVIARIYHLNYKLLTKLQVNITDLIMMIYKI